MVVCLSQGCRQHPVSCRCHVDQGEEEEKYVILKPGDGVSPDENKPVVAKTRRYEQENNIQDIEYYQSIVWPMRLNYYFGDKLNQLQQITETAR